MQNKGNGVGDEKPISNKSTKKLRSEKCAFKLAAYAQQDTAESIHHQGLPLLVGPQVHIELC